MSKALPGGIGTSVIAIAVSALAGPLARVAISTDAVTDAVDVVGAPAAISWATGGQDPACHPPPPPPDCQPDSPDPACHPAPLPARCHYVPFVPPGGL
ncbi:hypothetical protein [Mycobacterium sp.]|uniref:hypothetical protein n=1 Tax=Mycobacterium sp. TaxID=1785 RepID=UPI0031DBF8BA